MPRVSEPLYGAIEAGGTKFVCAIGHSPARILEQTVITTRKPTVTLTEVLNFFSAAQRSHGPIHSFGVGSFGPIDLRRESPTFGHLLNTPKAGWSGTDLLGMLTSQFSTPVILDTDVRAAALAELRMGAGRDVSSLAYVTVGTGIGGGFAPALLQEATLLHPEMGHLRVRRHSLDIDFPGICPFHGDCLEGLASGPAINARWGAQITGLDPDHSAWAIIGDYLGQLAASIALLASPQRIVFGGGVMIGGELLSWVRRAAGSYLNGYLAPLNDAAAVEGYICGAGLGDQAGIRGALLLAEQARI
jgi:fructokinase